MRHRYKKYFLDCLSDMLYLNSKSSVNHKLCEVNFIGSFSSDYIYKALLSLGLTEHCRRGGKIVRAIGSREFAVRQSPNNVRSITHKVSQKTQTWNELGGYQWTCQTVWGKAQKTSILHEELQASMEGWSTEKRLPNRRAYRLVVLCQRIGLETLIWVILYGLTIYIHTHREIYKACNNNEKSGCECEEQGRFGGRKRKEGK